MPLQGIDQVHPADKEKYEGIMTPTSTDRACRELSHELEQLIIDRPTFHQFTWLLPELQGRIITWLSDPRDKYRLFVTCQLAYTVLQGAFLADKGGAAWFVEALFKSSGFHFDEAARRIQERVTRMSQNAEDRRFQGLFSELIRQVSCRGCASMSDAWLSTVVKGGGERLKEIDFHRLQISEKSLAAIVQNCNGLERLTFAGNTVISYGAFCELLKRCGKQLMELDLSQTSFGDPHLIAIAQYCTKLKTLAVASCQYTTSCGLSVVLNRCGGTLVALDIHGVHVSDDLFAHIAKCGTKLERLDLSSCTGFTSKGILAVVSGCIGTLVELKLNDTDVTDDALIAIAQHAERLERLDLSDCLQITDVGLGYVMKHCTALKSLSLFSCSSLSGACFASLAEHDVALERLLLGGCRRMTATNLKIMAERCTSLLQCMLGPVSNPSEVLTTIARCATKLNDLDLTWNDHVTDVDLATIARSGTQLQRLSLQGCSLVTDTGVHHIATGCKKLVEIDLSRTSISDAGLINLVQQNRGLTILGAIQCNITDKALYSLMPHCRNLEELYLSNTFITDASFGIIVQYGNKLKKLGLVGCPLITAESFKRLQERLRGVELI